MNSTLRIVFLGDIIGKPGRRVVGKYLAKHKSEADLVIANVENSAHGFGLTEENLKELQQAGIQIFSGGNHTFDRREIFDFIGNYDTVLRPANYPDGTPGRGYCLFEVEGTKIAVINLMGRVFMEPLQSPFLVADALIEQLREQADILFVDMHAEATAEKIAMGWYLDGRVAAVVGTHTHVQTADERVLPGGTAFITDAGCCGPLDGVIGMDKQSVFRRLVKQLPSRFDVAAGIAQACGVKIEIDRKSGKAIAISRVKFQESEET
jgi:metallophosphoesterase (TIGR00282 family)